MADSDSDDILSSNNVLSFRKNDTIIRAETQSRINLQNTHLNVPRNFECSSMNMSRNLQNSIMNIQRNFRTTDYAESCYDQWSACNRRETSPASLRSCPNFHPRNLYQTNYGSGLSQRSMLNGRCGSPMSMHSVGTNASIVNAADIASALKNLKCDRFEITVIRDAYRKFMKGHIRKKIAKRRNRRLVRRIRRNSEYDSGEQGSDSSLSSEGSIVSNGKSIRSGSALYNGYNCNDRLNKENLHNSRQSNSCRSSRMDLNGFRKVIQDSNCYKDCSDNLQQNALRNILPVREMNSNSHTQNTQPNATPTLKERFTSNFKLPSQRFGNFTNRSILPIVREIDKIQVDNTDSMPSNIKNKNVFFSQNDESFHNNSKTESEDEQIFSIITSSRTNHKLVSNEGKATKTNIFPPKSNCLNTKPQVKNQVNGNTFRENTSDLEFEFIKPRLPVKRIDSAKMTEKLISKSSQPLKDDVIQNIQNLSQNSIETAQLPKQTKRGQKDNDPPQTEERLQNDQHSSSIRNKITKQTKREQTNQKKQNENNQLSPLQHSVNNISMKPSFSKRKLFTQTLDVIEGKNASSDSLQTNSPHNSIYSTSKEKNKARKLVTSQSCLNRDVLQDDNNLLNLIHKIVPADRINATNVTNKTAYNNSKDDKWNVASITSMSNNDDGSDTFTDEEIFNITYNRTVLNQKENANTNRASKKQKDVKTPNGQLNKKINIKADNIKIDKLKEPIIVVDKLKIPNETNDISKLNTTYKRADLFWDAISVESDTESTPVITQKPKVKERRKGKYDTFNSENDLSKTPEIALVQSDRRSSKRIASMSNKDNCSKSTKINDTNEKTDTSKKVLRNRVVKKT